jgi:hypothetical protein
LNVSFMDVVNDCKVNLRCSREGVAWKVKYGG